MGGPNELKRRPACRHKKEVGLQWKRKRVHQKRPFFWVNGGIEGRVKKSKWGSKMSHWYHKGSGGTATR